MNIKSLSATVLMLVFSTTAQSVPINWTDWGSSTTAPDVVIGSIGGIAVTYTGDFNFVQTGTGINYWTENGTPAPYTDSSVIDNAPTASEMIALTSIARHTITFSEAILNPVMAIVSMGQPNLPVSYDFDTDFTLLSNGVGYWSYANGGLPGSYTIDAAQDILTGNELHGAIQFNGLINQINWTSSPHENWHGITVGSLSTSVPEPSILVLIGIGLAGLGFIRRKKT